MPSHISTLFAPGPVPALLSKVQPRHPEPFGDVSSGKAGCDGHRSQRQRLQSTCRRTPGMRVDDVPSLVQQPSIPFPSPRSPRSRGTTPDRHPMYRFADCDARDSGRRAACVALRQWPGRSRLLLRRRPLRRRRRRRGHIRLGQLLLPLWDPRPESADRPPMWSATAIHSVGCLLLKFAKLSACITPRGLRRRGRDQGRPSKSEPLLRATMQLERRYSPNAFTDFEVTYAAGFSRGEPGRSNTLRNLEAPAPFTTIEFRLVYACECPAFTTPQLERELLLGPLACAAQPAALCWQRARGQASVAALSRSHLREQRIGAGSNRSAIAGRRFHVDAD